METGSINSNVDLLNNQKLESYVVENSENLIGPDFNSSYLEFVTINPTVENSVSLLQYNFKL